MVFSASAFTSAPLETSVTTARTVAPAAFSSLSAFASAPSSMSARTTLIPSAAKPAASARPMPLAAPVTTATLPLNSFTSSPLWSLPLGLEHAVLSRYPLQADGSPVSERELPGALRKLFQQRRGQDLAALRLPGDARRQVYVLPEEVVALLDRLAGVQADTHADGLGRGAARCAIGLGRGAARCARGR